MKSKTTSTSKSVKTEKSAKAAPPVKTGKANGVVSKLEKTNGSTKPVKVNGIAKRTRKQPSSAGVELTQDTGPKRPTFEQLKEQAYLIYLKEGRPNDRAMQHWLDAEAQLAGE